MPGGVHSWPGDSSLVFDEGNARLFIVGPDLKIHRSFSAQRAGTPYTIVPRGDRSRGPDLLRGAGLGRGRRTRRAPTRSPWRDSIVRTDRLEPVARILGSKRCRPGPRCGPAFPS